MPERRRRAVDGPERGEDLPESPDDLRVVVVDDTLVMSFRAPSRGSHAHLTATELDVLLDVTMGCSNREIARRRGRSVRTIANQVASILRKLGLQSRLEIVARAPLART